MPIIKGILKRKSEVGFTANDKKKRTFWLDCTGDYSKNILEFILYGENVTLLNNYKMKEELYVTYSPRGFISENRGKEKIMQSLSVSFIENEKERIARTKK